METQTTTRRADPVQIARILKRYYRAADDSAEQDAAVSAYEAETGQPFTDRRGFGCFDYLGQIEQANDAAGHHWFEPASMRFFNSKIAREVFGGCLFVSSERFDSSSPRLYSVRMASDRGHVESVGLDGFQAFQHASTAQIFAKALGKAIKAGAVSWTECRELSIPELRSLAAKV